MRLVDHDGKGLAALGGDLVEDEGKFLHRRDDDLFPLLDELAQVTGPLGMTHGRTHLHELLDGRLDLVVEEAPVGDHDDRVEDLLVAALQTNELVRQPCDGVRLAAARRMLDQVALARAVRAHIGQRLPHHTELVVARPHLPALLLAGARVLLRDDLRVVLEDVGQPRRGEHLFPQVVRLEAMRIGRVARAVVVALVEGQEPRALARKLGAHLHRAVVHREVHHAAAKLEQPLARVAVVLVLLDGVLDGLLGEAVLQLEGSDGQPVDEQAEVQRAARLVHAVGELARDRKTVLRVQRRGPGVARGRRREN